MTSIIVFQLGRERFLQAEERHWPLRCWSPGTGHPQMLDILTILTDHYLLKTILFNEINAKILQLLIFPQILSIRKSENQREREREEQEIVLKKE